jgi:chloramphenicol-sensitive protein RarD
METAILAPIAIGLLFYFLSIQHTAASRSTTTWSLLALGGPITTLPLVLFASAAQKVPLVAMGMLQYVGPSLQFLLGLFWFREEVSTVRFAGFVFVWLALALFTWGTILLEREKRLAK